MNKEKVFLSWKWVDDQLHNIGDRLEGFINDKKMFTVNIK